MFVGDVKGRFSLFLSVDLSRCVHVQFYTRTRKRFRLIPENSPKSINAEQDLLIDCCPRLRSASLLHVTVSDRTSRKKKKILFADTRLHTVVQRSNDQCSVLGPPVVVVLCTMEQPPENGIGFQCATRAFEYSDFIVKHILRFSYVHRAAAGEQTVLFC